jgi:hypothetical protein
VAVVELQGNPQVTQILGAPIVTAVFEDAASKRRIDFD